MRGKARCHPLRLAVTGSLCRWCALRSEPDPVLPARVPYVHQHLVSELPADCPKCGGIVRADMPLKAEAVLPRRVSCRLCGWDAYRA